MAAAGAEHPKSEENYVVADIPSIISLPVG